GAAWGMERQARRLASLEKNVARPALHSIHAVEGDGRHYAFPMPFDRVLVDAPCSGLGVLGRRADARWRKGAAILHEMPPVQLDLLAATAKHARPGGVIVYSVCSFEPEETEDVVERFLRQTPTILLESAAGVLPDAVVESQHFMRLSPHPPVCNGAFAAKSGRTCRPPRRPRRRPTRVAAGGPRHSRRWPRSRPPLSWSGSSCSTIS